MHIIPLIENLGTWYLEIQNLLYSLVSIIMIAFPQSDLRWAIHSAAALLSFSAAGSPPQRLRRLCISASADDGRTTPKPSVCTADELHYVPLPNNEWNLSLWRYLPSSQVLYIGISLPVYRNSENKLCMYNYENVCAAEPQESSSVIIVWSGH